MITEATATADIAPWWGVPVVAGGFLLLGAVLGYVFNRLQDERRAKRDQRTRWDQNVLDHTSRIVLLCIQLIQHSEEHEAAVDVLVQLAASKMRSGEPLDPPPVSQVTLTRLMDTYESLAVELVSMRLVTTSAIRAKADGVRDAAFLLLMAPDMHEIKQAGGKLRKASNSLEAAVREHFGIK